MDGAIALRASEAGALKGPGFYTGSGKKDETKIKNAKGGKKKIAVIALIIGILTGGGIFLGSATESLLPWGLSNQLTNFLADYGFGASTNAKVKTFANMSSGTMPSTKWARKLTSFPEWVRQRFSTQTDSITTTSNSISYNGQDISGNKFTSAYNSDGVLRNEISTGSYGRVIDVQDNTAINTKETKFNVNGNAFSGYQQTGNENADAASLKQTMNDQFDGKTSSSLSTTENEFERDEDGNIIGVTQNRQDSASTNGSTMSATERAAATTKYINDIAGRVGRYVSWGCTALRVGSLIAVTITGIQMYSYVREYLTTMENISKTMAGDGAQSALNSVMNRMTTPFTTKTDDLTDWSFKEGHTSVGGENADGNLELETGTVEYTGSAVEAPNLVAALSETAYDKETASKFSITSSLSTLVAALNVFNVTNVGCTIAQAAIAGVELATTVVAVGISLIPGGQIVAGGAMVWKGIKQFLWALLRGLILNFAVSAFVSFMVPALQQALFGNPDETMDGIPGGEQFAASAGATGSMFGRFNSGLSLASKDEAVAYSKEYQAVLAREAESDRLTRSPFDITSKNTFLGSIAHKLLPALINTSSSRGMLSVTTLLNSTSSAIASLTGSVSADGENTTYINTFAEEGVCPNLDDIGAVGDIYCNPITISDPATTNMGVEDPAYVDIIDQALDGCDENGDNCKVKANSNLARYISYCVDRTSPFGIADANILSELESGNVFLNALPIVGDVLSIMNATNVEENDKWATGAYCVNSSENDKWDEFKYYQKYVEQMRIVEQLGGFAESKNPVEAYREDYEAAHPTDNTLESYISKVAGISQDDAELVLDILAYYEFIEDYDPDTRIAMVEGGDTTIKTGAEVAAEIKAERLRLDDNQGPIETIIAKASDYYAIYADVRNRSYAV